MADNNKTAENVAKPASPCKIVNNIIIGEELVFPDEPLNVGEVLLNILRSKPECIGQVDAATGEQNTYSEMSERSVKCAIWLKKQGIKPGDVISLCTDNHLNAYVPFLASLYVGAICAPGDYEPTPYTARHYLSMAEPKVIFLHTYAVKTIKEAAKELGMNIKMVIFEDQGHGTETLNEILAKQTFPEVEEYRCTKIENPKDVALLVCSSGTTGLPKGTELSHLALRTVLHTSCDENMKNRVVSWAPALRWHYGVMQTLRALRAFATRIVAPDEDDSEIYCKIIDKYKVEFFGTEPGMVLQFIKLGLLKKYRLTSLKVLLVGGSYFKAEQQEQIAKLLPHTTILQIYGNTDSGNAFVNQTKDCQLGSCGFVLKGVQMKIVDTTTGDSLGPNKRGEVCVKTTSMMNGYRNNPEATNAAFDSDGWLHTGDIGYYAENGELFVVDRITEFIIYRGTVLSAAEIEIVLERHPAVLKAAVIPLACELSGELPLAIVSKLPNKEVTEKELIDFVDEHLPEFYGLRGGVKFVDKLPRTVTGKIAKKELKKIFGSPQNLKNCHTHHHC